MRTRTKQKQHEETMPGEVAEPRGPAEVQLPEVRSSRQEVTEGPREKLTQLADGISQIQPEAPKPPKPPRPKRQRLQRVYERLGEGFD